MSSRRSRSEGRVREKEQARLAVSTYEAQLADHEAQIAELIPQFDELTDAGERSVLRRRLSLLEEARDHIAEALEAMSAVAIETTDPGVLENLNTPRDLKAPSR